MATSLINFGFATGEQFERLSDAASDTAATASSALREYQFQVNGETISFTAGSWHELHEGLRKIYDDIPAVGTQ